MPQLRALLLTLWLLLCFLFGFLLSLTRWKNPIWNRFVLNAFGFGARYIGGVRIHPIDKHRSDSVGPCVYVANHQSGLDMAVYGTVFPKLGVMVGKRELVYVPILGWFFVGGGNVMINRGNRRSAVGSLAEAVDRIKRKGHSICIFPEGTRNKSLEGFLPFKKGAFYLAIDAQCPIIPVVA
ncbi:MAG: lysophospholipid acyltransferase family protein, partial [Bacteriovoracia bacterium]